MYADLKIYILDCLFEGEVLTKKQLTEDYLEQAGLENKDLDKTIYRKVKDLKEEGWDIRVSNKGYKIVLEDENLQPTSSSRASDKELVSSVMMLGKFDQTIGRLVPKEVFNVKRKLAKLSGLQTKSITESSFVDVTPDKMSDDQIEAFGKLARYIINGRPIELLYRELEEKETKLWKVFPIQLKERDGIWYLIGYDYNSEKGVRFNMKRVSDVKGKMNEQKPPAEAVQKVLQQGVFSVWDYGDEPVTMLIKLYDYAAHYIRESFIHPSQKIQEISENEVIVSFKSSDFIGVNLWMRKFAPLVEVLEPKRLRDDFRRDLENALKRQR